MRPCVASSAEELEGPADPRGDRAVDRLVEHQHRGVAEQRGGNAEPLPHAEREARVAGLL